MSDANERQSVEAVPERRAELRVPATTLGDVSTRLIGGSDITLLNYTARSLYGQSPSRLIVGARISVRLATATLNAVVAGRVIRSSLTQIVEGVPRYEVAVQLDQDVDWAAAGEQQALVPERHALVPERREDLAPDYRADVDVEGSVSR